MWLVEIFKIYDARHHEIPLIPGLPPDKADCHIVGAQECYGKLDDNNVMFFRSVNLGEIYISRSHYCFDRPATIFIYAGRHTLEFHNLLVGTAQFRNADGPWRRTIEGNYNGIYTEKTDNEVYFRGEVETFDIQITVEHFLKLAEQYPVLQPFSAEIKTASNAVLFRELSSNSMRSYLLMVQITQLLERKGKCQEVRELADELLIELIVNRKEHRKYRFGYRDVERLWFAYRTITERMDEEDILEKQIRESLLGKDKFREGFHILFHAAPKHFLLSIRMENAKSLIDLGYSLSQICERTGYAMPKRLEEAFYLYFGYRIKEYRHRLH